MLDLIMGLLSGGNGLLVGLGAVLAAVAAAFFKGRSTGKQSERDKVTEERLRARTEADRIDDAIAGRDPADNRKRLGEWFKS